MAEKLVVLLVDLTVVDSADKTGCVDGYVDGCTEGLLVG